MKIKIYKTPAVELNDSIDVFVFNDQVTRTLNGLEQITFRVESTTPILLLLGATIHAPIGVYKYWYMNSLPVYEKVSERLHIYDFTFQAPLFDLGKIAFLNASGEGEFFYNATPAMFAALIVYNLEQAAAAIPSTWSAGVSDVADYKNLQFQNQTCLQALNIVADAFDLEYKIDVSGNDFTIAFVEKIGAATGITLKYGAGYGLKNIKRTNVNTDNLITRLYYSGSDRNLPLNYGSRRLKGSANYIERNVANFGRRDGFKNFDEVKPQYIGEVTSFIINDDDEHLLTDLLIPFDLTEEINGETTYLVNGTTAKINFLTGKCAGYVFDVADYDHLHHTIKLIKYKDQGGYEVPNATIQPDIEDKYVIFDIKMPAAYVLAAEAALDTVASDYLDLYCTPRVAYTLLSNTNYFSDNDILLNLGDQLTIDDNDLNIESTCRVIEMIHPLFDLYDVTIKLSDVRFAMPDRANKLRLKKLDILLNASKIDTVEKIQKSEKTTNELKNRIYNVNDEFFIPENNKIESLDPFMLALDSGEIQFSIKNIEITPYANEVKYTSGTIIHHSIKGKTRAEIEKLGGAYDPTREWSVTGSSAVLSNPSEGYFVYLDIPLTTEPLATEATILFDTEHVLAKSVEDHIIYKIGYIDHVVDECRNLYQLWGNSFNRNLLPKAGVITLTEGIHTINFPNEAIKNYTPLAYGKIAGDWRTIAIPTNNYTSEGFDVKVPRDCTVYWNITIHNS